MCTLANLSFPLFPNFIAEYLCLTSIFSVHSLYAYIFCICQVLGTVASFWAFNRIIHGMPYSLPKNYHVTPETTNSMMLQYTSWATPLSRLEYCMVLPLMIGIIWLGVKPMA